MQSKILVLFCFFVSVCSCRNVARVAIDSKQVVKLDTNLLGIWKAAEDTNKKDFIFIQSCFDANENVWPYLTDSVKKLKDYECYITRMDNGGHNPHYEQWGCFLSKVGSFTFLNVPYRNDNLKWSERKSTTNLYEGFCFVRLVFISKGYDTITTAYVSDTTLCRFKTSQELRAYFTKNVTRSSFYCDTLHWYRVSHYHHQMVAAVKVANP